MKSPSEQTIIQIDITNACTHQCSNCTRFCGHHQKPFFMDFETFKKAVDSLADFPGMVGMMGGEPTLHPDFERLATHFAARCGPQGKLHNAREPIADFNIHKMEKLSDLHVKRGLWTSLGKKYYQHFELIQDVFEYQCVNDHQNAGLHQALLITRKELGIPDDEWIKLRDDCWIQKYWSASVTPKGAFFCEVAGALDMLFDGPGGWPIEPGWWQRTPDQFGDQLQWCELCSAALNVPRTQADLERDDVSPLLLERLRQADSPKLRRGQVKTFDAANYAPRDLHHEYYTEWYLPSGDNTRRVGATNRSIYPQKLSALLVADLPPEHLNGQFDQVSLSFDELTDPDWVAAVYGDVRFPDDFEARVKNLILNPGCAYHYSPDAKTDHPFAVSPDAKRYFILFNPRAQALQDGDIPYLDPLELLALYEPDKVVALQDSCDLVATEIPKRLERKLKGSLMRSHMLSLWKALADTHAKVALFPAGLHATWFLQNVRANDLPMPSVIVDDNPKLGSILGTPVIPSSELDPAAHDALFICNHLIADKLIARAQELWPEMKVVYPYEFFDDPDFDEEWTNQ